MLWRGSQAQTKAARPGQGECPLEAPGVSLSPSALRGGGWPTNARSPLTPGQGVIN